MPGRQSQCHARNVNQKGLELLFTKSTELVLVTKIILRSYKKLFMTHC